MKYISDYPDFVDYIEYWHVESGISSKSNEDAQWNKHDEEVYEACKEHLDCIVCLLNAGMLGADLDIVKAEVEYHKQIISDLLPEDDIIRLYNQVAEKLDSRLGKGKMVDGMFVKEERL